MKAYLKLLLGIGVLMLLITIVRAVDNQTGYTARSMATTQPVAAAIPAPVAQPVEPDTPAPAPTLHWNEAACKAFAKINGTFTEIRNKGTSQAAVDSFVDTIDEISDSERWLYHGAVKSIYANPDLTPEGAVRSAYAGCMEVVKSADED